MNLVDLLSAELLETQTILETVPKSQTRSLAEHAKELGLNFFLVSFTDLLGGTRAKLVPATKIVDVESTGACFAPFACNLGLDLDAHDVAAIPDYNQLNLTIKNAMHTILKLQIRNCSNI